MAGVRGMVLLAVVAGAMIATGCLSLDNATCASGRVCPSGSVCSRTGDACGLPEQVEACANIADDEACAFPGGVGICRQGVCEGFICGNEVVEPGETCDDGNTADGDGCSADCLDEERCGDGIVADDEECDCGDGVVSLPQNCSSPNSLVGGTCNPMDCTLYCGDGQVQSWESCDPGELGPIVNVAPIDCVAYGLEVGMLGCSASCGFDVNRCRRLGWSDTLANVPQSVAITGLWVSPWTIAGPPEPGLMRFDAAAAITTSDGGLAWIAGSTKPPDARPMRAVWGDPGTDIDDVVLFAVGDQGQIFRYHRSTFWAPESSGSTEDLLAVWGVDRDSVMTVGASGTALRFDGSNWSSTTTNSSVTLRGLYGRSATDMIAVGDGGAALHWDGTAWTPSSTGSGSNLRGVWMDSTGLAYAVGDSGTVLRYAAGGWTTVDIGTAIDLTSVWGRSETDLFVGAADGTVFFRGVDGVWTPTFTSSTDPIGALGGSGAFTYAGSSTFRSFTGDAWTSDVMNAGVAMNDVEVSPTGTFFAVGDSGTVLRWNRGQWDDISPPSVVDLQSVWAAADDDVYVVGADSTVLHYDGSWQDISIPTPGIALRGVWADGSGYVIVVGDSMYTRTSTGGWPEVDELGGNLVAVWGSSAQSVHALAGDGTTWTLAGTWEPLPPFFQSVDGDIKAAFTGDRVYVAHTTSTLGGAITSLTDSGDGEAGEVRVPRASPLFRGFRAVAVVSDTKAYFAGADGFLVEATEVGWGRIKTRITGTITGVAATNQFVALVSEDGSLDVLVRAP